MICSSGAASAVPSLSTKVLRISAALLALLALPYLPTDGIIALLVMS